LLRQRRWSYQAFARSRVFEEAQRKTMTPYDAGTSTKPDRRARLAASLRENLKRRKAQQRSRAASADEPCSGAPHADRADAGNESDR
jgi:hypothetical protein